MNARRAANRARSKADGISYREPETHMSMGGRKVPTREPEHHEEGYRAQHEPHASHGSPASLGTSKGPGPVAGAGELHSPGAGPGRAAQRIAGRDRSESPTRPTPSGETPKGMKVYAEE